MRSYRIKSISFVHACYCNNVDVHRVRQFLTGIVALDCDGVHQLSTWRTGVSPSYEIPIMLQEQTRGSRIVVTAYVLREKKWRAKRHEMPHTIGDP